MNIVAIEQSWPKNKLRIELALGNVCNYMCHYCFPGSNEGDKRWPDYFPFIQNLDHLLNHYKAAGKDQFEIHLIGGEPTLWPRLGEFVKHLKDNYNCLISMSSNGSRSLRWWREYGSYFDKVMLSAHHEAINVDHYIDVADLLYEKNVIITSLVLADPLAWEKCLGLVERFKTSKGRWAIDLQELINTDYTDEQKKLLSQWRLRQTNPLRHWIHNKYKTPTSKVVFEDNSRLSVKNNEIVLRRWNNFKGWDCNLGVDTLCVNFDGDLTGQCGNNLYGLDFKYNLKSPTFVEDFAPIIKSTFCHTDVCWCQPEVNVSKFNLGQGDVSSTRTIIPIANYRTGGY